MKKFKIVFTLILMLSLIVQPRIILAADIGPDHSLVYSRPGLYWQLAKSDRIAKSDPEQWIKSGNYSYGFLDRQKRYITIRKIDSGAVADGKLIIPKEIDGFKVLGIGVWEIIADRAPYEDLHYMDYYDEPFESVQKQYQVIDEIEKIEEIVLPEGLEFLGAFSLYGCYNLKSITLPDSMVFIGSHALGNSRSLLEIEFPPDIYVSGLTFVSMPMKIDSLFCPKKLILYSDSVLGSDSISAIGLSKENKAEVYIRYHNQRSFYYTLCGYVDKLYVDKKISFLALSSYVSDGESDYMDAPPPSYKVDRLIMNGKGTSLQFPYYANEPSVNDLAVLDKDGSWISGVNGLYTVKGAASIAQVRGYKTPYYWKETGKAREVKAKKKGSIYQVSWKKIKTIVHKHEYMVKKKKWKTTKSPIQTVYKVYGKKKKSDSYQFIKTTKKKSIKSKYKYIKAVPVKEWE